MKFLCCLLMMILIVSHTLSSELKILNLPEEQTGPAPCALTCSGVSRYSETGNYGWRSYAGSKSLKIADIAGCGFVSVPVVTVSVKSPYCPLIQISFVRNKLLVLITVEDATPGNMISGKCDVNWIATGYVC